MPSRGLPESLAATRPGTGRWSAIECVEHIAVAEDFLLTQITRAERSGVPLVSQRREAAILARGADRNKRLMSPEVARPAGRFPTLADALAGFLTTREQTVRFVETCDEDLRSKPMTHPLMGTINCHEALLLIAVHPRCHAGQILEIRAAPG